TGFRIERAALDGKGESYTMDGSAASAKLLGDLDTFVLGRASLHVQPNTWLHAMGDHVVTFSLLPLAADQTMARTTCLVARADAPARPRHLRPRPGIAARPAEHVVPCDGRPRRDLQSAPAGRG